MMAERSDSPQGQTILEHLNELRIRLTWAVAGLAVGTLISFIFAQQLLEFLITPYGERLQITSPTENIEIFFKVSLVAGGVLAMPWILYQIWLFVVPALERNEKRYVYIFIPSAFALFLLGIAFSWFVLLPAAIAFLSGFMPDVFFVEWTASEFVSFTTTFLFWIGVSFEMPLIVYLVSRAGLISSRTLREQWRIAIVGIAVVAAAVTPSIDPVTMLLTMVPLVLLYGLSILLARVGQRQFERSMSIE
ncbi:MAG: twin-arginine translocase subunit TatC [Candidatus Promineifilaceae bacterium]|nr:twin-arginine translocase subunit TatC [Candidatus Promineifilaceae bacterium]